MAKVDWRPVPNWEGFYEVCASGRVRSCDRQFVVLNPHGAPGTRTYKGRRLKLFITGKGYTSVKLSRPGRRKTAYVHEIVLAAFVGPRPVGLETCHNNGDPADSRLRNLRYDTRRANAIDAQKHKRMRRGK